MFDREGKALTANQFLTLFLDEDYVVVNRDEIDCYLVSTVWLGINHNWWGGEPLIFETMVFLQLADGTTDCAGLLQHRFETEEQAKKGHLAACAFVQAGLLMNGMGELMP